VSNDGHLRVKAASNRNMLAVRWYRIYEEFKVVAPGEDQNDATSGWRSKMLQISDRLGI